jgi:glutamyl/glutaminyl-tRNA synthetase
MRAWLALVVEAVVARVDTLSQVVQETEIIFEYDLDVAAQLDDVREVLHDAGAVEVIRALDEALSRQPAPVTLEMFQAATEAAKRRTGRKGKSLFHPVRVALTGRASGPELVKLVPIYEQGSRLALPRPVLGVRDRLNGFLRRAGAA